MTPRLLLLLLLILSPGTTLANLYQEVDKRIVCIKTVDRAGSQLLGTGFYVGEDYIATASHQVVNAKEIFLYMGENYAKTEVWYDHPPWDIALLRAPKLPLSPLLLGDGSPPELGADVFTIGCPMGLDHSLSRGVISHPDRQIADVHYIQSDLEINSGNSGGPLLNQRGEVIGVIKGSWQGGEGLHFAVPTDYLKKAIAQARLTPASVRGIPDSQMEKGEKEYRMGTTHFKNRQFQSAKEFFEKAIALKPDFYQAHANLGLTLFQLKEYEAAEDALISAITLNSEYAVAYLNLGVVYAEGLGKKRAAKSAFERYLELSPQGEDAQKVRDLLNNLQ